MWTDVETTTEIPFKDFHLNDASSHKVPFRKTMCNGCLRSLSSSLNRRMFIRYSHLRLKDLHSLILFEVLIEKSAHKPETTLIRSSYRHLNISFVFIQSFLILLIPTWHRTKVLSKTLSLNLIDLLRHYIFTTISTKIRFFLFVTEWK